VKPVVENNLIGDQFFLTRQTANLMADFTRDIEKGSSIFLLYGIDLVGKSRLLKELANREIENHKFCWINFKSDDDEAAGSEESSGSDSNNFVNEVRELMEAADERDVILADHFELASNKAKHQLFQSWATDGVDKNINLVMATTTGSFNEVRQLAQQYKIKIKSFQLMPCSMSEVEAFLGFYLFPASPLNSLSIPSNIKKQLRSCNGVLGKVIELADQRGKQISIKPDSDSESNNYTVIAAGSLIIMVIVISIIYQYWQPADMPGGSLPVPSDRTITIISDSEDIVSINQPEPDSTDSSDETIPSTGGLDLVDQERITPDIAELEIQSVNNNAAAVGQQIEPEPSGVAVEIASNLKSETSKNKNIEQPSSRYQPVLDNSREWIQGQDKNRGTIQIMMIGLESFNEGAYHRFLGKLQSSNIDVSEIRIYQALMNESVVFGVIFGDYESRREASKSIKHLPDALREREPIPRSLGGIWDEINNK
jgi:septal ring-binding cell division protein DamX